MSHERFITFGRWGFAPNYDLPIVVRIIADYERRWSPLTDIRLKS